MRVVLKGSEKVRGYWHVGITSLEFVNYARILLTLAVASADLWSIGSIVGVSITKLQCKLLSTWRSCAR